MAQPTDVGRPAHSAQNDGTIKADGKQHEAMLLALLFEG
jgi:hypothetical protein